MKRIVLLGATGSIGRQTCQVISAFPEEFQLVGASCGGNRSGLEAIAKEFAVPASNLALGDEAVQLAKLDCDLVVVAIPGTASLKPALAAIEAGHDVALASKEVLVMAGALIQEAQRKSGAKIWPIDSEHCAMAQCLRGEDLSTVRRLVITASGGPFWQLPKEEWTSITVEQALTHPTWSMGQKVTIDSATMMNKAQEVIEAHWLFGIDESRIDAVIQPQSLVHAMVEFCDGATIAQIAPADMRLPISYAISGGRRLPGVIAPAKVDATAIEFHPIDPVKFPAIAFARSVLKSGGVASAVMAAADEAAVNLFLSGRIGFMEIVPAVERALDAAPRTPGSSIDEVMGAVDWASNFVVSGLPVGARA